MTRSAPSLSPFSLGLLLGRIAHEWATRGRIFDLPASRFFDASAAPDLSVRFLGRPAATPLGPASGPHTQLAENIVLAWLGGARIVELKTVQVLDELDISRPCIDMETVGYNVEWSQELPIGRSLEEYVKAWMIIEILRGWDELRPFIGPDPGPHIFDLSVGYDLAGISSDKVAAYIDGMIDAGRDDRAPPPGDPGAVRGMAGSPVPDPDRRLGHAVDVPRLPAGRDRRDHQTPDDPPRARRRREAESDPSRLRPGRRDPVRASSATRRSGFAAPTSRPTCRSPGPSSSSAISTHSPETTGDGSGSSSPTRSSSRTTGASSRTTRCTCPARPST